MSASTPGTAAAPEADCATEAAAATPVPALRPAAEPTRPAEHESEAEAGTRRRVLDLIAADGPVSAAELAAELD
jgi:hypothetical protein